MKLITLFFPVTKLFTAAIEKYMADEAIKARESRPSFRCLKVQSNPGSRASPGLREKSLFNEICQT